ncbi:chemotaxis protein CheY [Sulfurifustis variabilis]|uniref:Chemotaxis protein CheY n=1 Tax=Sulfurifustis variabilis TaxID=1675686 RepID=A0A1B4V721_9GAMM|nr:CheR family methyltransferase [Sulfurifustis variabilis]BAU49339.1 chemotaxis protein CheY [Sulfurifustis variabilis]
MISDSDDQDNAKRPERPAPTLVVGVGASAGGLDPCRRLLADAPADKNIAFVVVLHLAPSQESHVAAIFKTVTRMAVTQVAGRERIEPNHVYVIAPATSLGIRDGILEVGEPAKPHYKARPIDAFFSALAADQRDRAVGIVLSGTGNDGAAGLKDIRSAGGLCLVQDPGTAEYDGMPRSAVETGAADAVVPAEEMGRILLEYAGAPGVRPRVREPAERRTSEERAEGLDAILALLGNRYRVDFRDYKKNTLERRTQRRMGLKQIADWQDYLAYLRAHPEEAEALYSDVLIGVTRFFRDPEEWKFLEQQVVPELLASHDADAPVRIWSAGCATGEEAYSLAMVFLEHIERAGGRLKLQVFASDVSHEALAFARRGLYPAGIEEDVPPERLRRFFRRVGEHFQMDRDLRERVTFAAHNLLADPPFAGVDLVSCRNVLIYLEPHAQERLLDLFHFSLRPHGVLWLGSAETIGGRSASFNEITGKHRMYRSVGRARPERYRVPHWVAERGPIHGLPPEPAGPPTAPQIARRLEQWVLQRYTSACVVIDRNLRILYFFGPTGEYLTQPVGEARMDLLSWARPGLYAKLRTGLADAVEHGHKVTVTGMRRERDTGSARVDATIEPTTPVPGADGLFVVTFRDVPKPARVRPPAEGGAPAEALVHQLEQELQEARQELQTTVAQLVNVNEEHYASHEELLSLNEELQSSNEELETSKEELQSLNEELTTTNRQLEERNTELRTITSDLNNLLVSANVPTLFLDRQLRIRRFTPACTQVMRVVPTDVGRSFEHVKMQVRDDDLLADAGRVLENLAPIEAEVTTDDGRWFFRRVLTYRSDEERVDGVCITFHDITAQKRAAAEIEDARLFAEAIIRTSRTPLLVLDAELRVVSANEAFYEAFQVSDRETEGRRIYDLGNHQWDIPKLRHLLEALPAERAVRSYDVEHVFDSIGWRAMRLNADLMKRASQPDLILVSIEDVTDLRKAELAAQRRADELAEDHRRKDEFLAMLGHELRNPLAALANGLTVLRAAGGEADVVERTLAMMARQTRRMTAMLDQLLDVARVSSGKFALAQEAVDVVDAATAAVETVQPMLESAGHELTVSLPPKGTALVLGDGVRLVQVAENLLGNAVKYTETGGRIWLTVSAIGDTVKLSVRDTGIGLEPDMLDHVFDLFTQASRSLHRAKGGLGLGLPLVRSLVEMHRGHVDAYSAGLGQGSEFVVTLPRLHIGQVPRPRDGEAGLPAVLSRRVLVVEDENDAAQSLADLLTIRGHDVRTVPDGLAALDTARAFKPDVVILDLGLPKMDGYQVARKLREEQGKRMLLVALTGYKKDAARLSEAGFDEHLLKPPDLAKLLDLLGAIDDRSLGDVPEPRAAHD